MLQLPKTAQVRAIRPVYVAGRWLQPGDEVELAYADARMLMSAAKVELIADGPAPQPEPAPPAAEPAVEPATRPAKKSAA